MASAYVDSSALVAVAFDEPCADAVRLVSKRMAAANPSSG